MQELRNKPAILHSASQRAWDEMRKDLMRGDELAEKVSQPINSARPPLRQHFKDSEPVLMIKTNIWGRPWHFWFYPSRLRRSRSGRAYWQLALPSAAKIKGAERTWNSIPRTKPQAAFNSWQQLLFTQQHTQVESRVRIAPSFFFFSLFFPLSEDQAGDECYKLVLRHRNQTAVRSQRKVICHSLMNDNKEQWLEDLTSEENKRAEEKTRWTTRIYVVLFTQ